MFKTAHDAANREVVRAVIRAELNLVGIAMRAERKVIDKIVDGLKFHSWTCIERSVCATIPASHLLRANA
jgi:hypothetical protein